MLCGTVLFPWHLGRIFYEIRLIVHNDDFPSPDMEGGNADDISRLLELVAACPFFYFGPHALYDMMC